MENNCNNTNRNSSSFVDDNDASQDDDNKNSKNDSNNNKNDEFEHIESSPALSSSFVRDRTGRKIFNLNDCERDNDHDGNRNSVLRSDVAPLGVEHYYRLRGHENSISNIPLTESLMAMGDSVLSPNSDMNHYLYEYGFSSDKKNEQFSKYSKYVSSQHYGRKSSRSRSKTNESNDHRDNINRSNMNSVTNFNDGRPRNKHRKQGKKRGHRWNDENVRINEMNNSNRNSSNNESNNRMSMDCMMNVNNMNDTNNDKQRHIGRSRLSQVPVVMHNLLRMKWSMHCNLLVVIVV